MVTGTIAQQTMPLKEIKVEQPTNGSGANTNPTSNTAATAPTTVPPPPVKSDRRSNKPIMEKRRRARINNCLNELKTLILDATKKDPARHSKLEKADILEKTVKHLQELQRQHSAMAQALDPKIVNKFKAGFTECANEVSRFPDIDPQIKRRLMQHLSNCINGVKSELGQQIRQQRQQQQQQQQLTQIQQSVQMPNMLPSPPSSPEQDHHIIQTQRHLIHATATTIPATQIQATPNGYFLPNGVQVYPTKLSNGTFALILPQQPHHQQQQQHPHHQQQQVIVQQQSQLPMLVPIPNRTASTGSATSVISNASYEQQRIHSPIQQQHIIHQQQQSQIHYAPPSPANSYEAMDCQYSNSQQQTVIHHSSSQQTQQQAYQSPQRQSPVLFENPYYMQDKYHYEQQNQYDDIDDGSAPLSLVIKKNNSREDEQQCWRPW